MRAVDVLRERGGGDTEGMFSLPGMGMGMGVGQAL
jgi:hypothetical protein